MQTTSPSDSDANREEALRLAKENATKTYGSLEKYNVFVCEQPVFWRVLLEPKDTRANQKGVAYLISKRKSWIVNSHEFPLPSDGTSKERLPGEGVSDRDGAVAIAKKDAIAAYDSLAPYDLAVCELTKVWIVVYSLKEGLNGGGPEYVIDKRTGRILDKKYYQ